MRLKPVMTEKSMADAREGRYTFWVPRGVRKNDIGRIVSEIFGVHVRDVRTMNYKARVKTNVWRKKVGVAASKKAVVTLAPGEKIELFGESEKKKKRKKK